MNSSTHSRMYKIRFIHRQKSYMLHVSEVALARGAVSYAVKLQNYKGLFIENNDQWKVISRSITSDGMQKHIIEQLKLHCNLLKLLDSSLIKNSALI